MLIGILLIIFWIYIFSNSDDSSSKSNSSSYSNNYKKKSNTNTSLSNRSSSSSYTSKNRSKSSTNYGIKSNTSSTSSGYNARPSSSYTKSSTKKKYDSEKDLGPYKSTDRIYRNNSDKAIDKPKAYFNAANSDKYGYNKEKDKFKDWKEWKAIDKKTSSSPIYHKKGGEYYTPNGEKIRNIGAYYNSVKKKKN